MELKIGHLLGRTLTEARNNDNEEIVFRTAQGETFKLMHFQDCCENVRVEDIDGDLQDLVGWPILQAEESSNSDQGAKDDYDESYTWTFYKLATVKGSVTIRWYGSSNGYYGESVDFVSA